MANRRRSPGLRAAASPRSPERPALPGHRDGRKVPARGPRGQTPESKTEIVLLLPPAPELRDEGAIAAAVEIVVSRNPVLSAELSRSGRGQPPILSAERQVPGELYLRIYKPASVNGRRRDVPADAFAASPMRSVSYPQFEPRGEY